MVRVNLTGAHGLKLKAHSKKNFDPSDYQLSAFWVTLTFGFHRLKFIKE
jgi:hypothetical protein